MGLTEIIWDGDEATPPQLAVYVDLLDSFGDRIKSPGTFRMELYQYVPRSSINTGARIAAWDDINLYRLLDNSSYWQDHLRTYKFELLLGFFPQPDRKYIIQATCITPSGRHLTDTRQVTYEK